MTTKNRFAALLLTALALLAATGLLRADDSVVMARGFKPNTVFQHNEFDSVNLFNGNLIVNVPLGVQYKSNGSLTYQFSLNYNSHVWDLMHYTAINFGSADFQKHGIIYWEYSSGWGGQWTPIPESAPAPGGITTPPSSSTATGAGPNQVVTHDGNWSGVESIPHGNAGMGWMFSLGTFDGQNYTAQDGTLSTFYQALHGGPGGTTSTYYTNDGTYLRLRKLANDPSNQQQVEIDSPDGMRRHYTCVDCPGVWRQQWNLDWIADPYGNVLLVEYTNGQGQYAPMQPSSGPWIWTFLEMSAKNAEQGSGTQYFDGSLEHRLNLALIRSHFAYFTRPRPWETRLDKIALAAPNGKYALYELVYSNMTIPSTIGIPMWDEAGIVARYVIENDPVTGRPKARRSASGLAAIKIADPNGVTTPGPNSTNTASAGVWQFRYYDNPDGYPGDPAPVQYPHADYPVSYLSGRLRVAKPPTGGGYRYEYAGRGYPTRLCHLIDGGGGVHFTGVSKRQQLDHEEDDIPNGAWYYVGRGWLRTSDFGTTCPSAKEYVTAVIAPPNENNAQSRISVAFFTAVSLSGFGMSRQGWPYTELEILCPDPNQDCNGQPTAKYLSMREVAGDYGTFAADPTGSVRRMFPRYLRTGETQTPYTIKRSTYARFESSFDDCPNGVNDMGCISFNLRKTLDRKVFHDDGDAWIETTFSQFDGLGHFRRGQTTSNFQQKNGPNMPVAWKTEDRVAIATWNPGVNYGGGSGVLPDGAPGPNQPWFIEKYASTSVEEGGFTFTKLYEFDPGRNFIKSVRALVDLSDPPTPADEDVLHTVERTGRLESGIPVVNVRESWFGGDTGDFTEATYVKDRLLRYGSPASEEYKNCNVGGSPFLILQSSAIDVNTGLATAITDSAGSVSSYAYDALGRITGVTPPGSSTPQLYAYRYATQGRSGLEGPNNLGTYADSSLKITRGTGPDLAYFFDFLGRQHREEEKLPSSAINWTTFAYSPQGLLTDETTLIPGNSQQAVTEYTYDVLDRQTKVKHPDGMTRDFLLTGERVKTTRNNKVAIGTSGLDEVSITENLDAFGRVRRVNDNAVRADYWWDAASNLTRVDLNDNGNDNDQSRFFSYDGRGFLTGETHPELGPGTVKHQLIDARGHSQRLHYVSDGNLDLDFTFDKAERMIQVRARHAPIAGAASWLTQFIYHPQDGSTVPAGTKAAGKLHKAQRRNFVPTPNNLAQPTAIEVKKTYGYDGRGRVSSVTLNSRYNGEFNAKTELHYDDLDQMTQIDYPSIAPVGSGAPFAPSRTITQSFSRGKLTGLSASGTSNWSIATLGYHANGLLASVTRTRSGAIVPSLVDRIDPDGTGVRRPSRFTWEYVTSPPSQVKVTADSGQYFFDGAGNVYLIGNDKYRYDTAYRLKTATIDSRTRTWDYDGFGNFKTRPATNDQSVTVTVDPATNYESGIVYDKLGNVTEMPDGRPPSIVPGGPAAPKLNFKYDLLSAMTNFDGNLIGRIFLYDADGQRVATLDYKAPGGLREHWYLRGINDMVLRDFDRTAGTWSWVKDYVYREGTLSSTIGAGESLRDVHVDHLGSTRLVTDSKGVPVVIGSTTDSLRKYWPFGELTVTRAIAERMSFTGHERDDDGTDFADADLDYMHARYYAPVHGRFLSFDQGAPELRQPQSWNRYAYAHNNPVRYVDPDGNIPVETILDVASLGSSIYSMCAAPSWANFGYLAWDAGSVFLPYVPGSWIAKVGKYGHRGLQAMGIVHKLDALETAVNNQLVREGVALLGQGDESVRQALGMSGKAADFLGVTKGGTFKIVEAKGNDIHKAVQQLSATADALKKKLGSGVSFTAEIALKKGQQLTGDFRVIGNHLQEFNSATNKWERVKIDGVQVIVREIK